MFLVNHVILIWFSCFCFLQIITRIAGIVQVAQNVPTTILKNTKRSFFYELVSFFFLHVVMKKSIQIKQNLGKFEIHSKLGQLEKKHFLKKND